MKNTKRHGRARTPEYMAWVNMRHRCLNEAHKQYRDYGGRGIDICDRWLDDFDAFLADMGERPSSLHSIDRIDNNGGYSPDNCKWSTRAEQQRNLRSNHVIAWRGRVMVLTDWARELGMSVNLLSHRFGNGWTVKQAFTTPVRLRARAA